MRGFNVAEVEQEQGGKKEEARGGDATHAKQRHTVILIECYKITLF